MRIMDNSASVPSEFERIVGGFVSLMSSALTLEKENDSLKNSADVLPKFISRHQSRNAICMVMPALMIRGPYGEFSKSNNGNTPKEKAALNLARRVTLTSKELESAPMVLLMNLIKSFTFLIDSRLRSSIQVLVQKSQYEYNPSFNRVLAGLLACSNRPIAPSTVVTSFRVLPNSEFSNSGEVVMPLVLEAVIDLKIFQNLFTIKVVAPGTIKALLANDLRIGKAEIVLDTVAFLASLMKQARYAVRKSIEHATKITTCLLGLDLGLQKPQPPAPAPPRKNDSLSNISSFGSLTLPNVTLSSQNLKLQLAAAQQAMSADSSLMPKPMSRLGLRSSRSNSKRSFSELKSLLNHPSFGPNNDMSSFGQKNADWQGMNDLQLREKAIAGGLSLLTAAARMNQKPSQNNNNHKRSNSHSNSNKSKSSNNENNTDSNNEDRNSSSVKNEENNSNGNNDNDNNKNIDNDNNNNNKRSNENIDSSSSSSSVKRPKLEELSVLSFGGGGGNIANNIRKATSCPRLT